MMKIIWSVTCGCWLLPAESWTCLTLIVVLANWFDMTSYIVLWVSLLAVVVAYSRSNKYSCIRFRMQSNISKIQQTEHNGTCTLPKTPSAHHHRADGSLGNNKATISMNNKLLTTIYQMDKEVSTATKVNSYGIWSKIYMVIKLSLVSLMLLLVCFTVVHVWYIQRDIGVLTSCMQFPVAFRGSYMLQRGRSNRKIPRTHRLVKMRNKCWRISWIII